MDNALSLYLYSNMNSLFDYLGRRMIPAPCILSERTGTQSLSTLNEYSFFITHKKLSDSLRHHGIGQHEGVYPITLELSFSKEQAKSYPAVLVSIKYEIKVYELKTLADYEPNNHEGAYVFAELPFSVVKFIIFETEEDKIRFSRPSPDYWFPEELYRILPKEDFTDEQLTCIDDKVNYELADISEADIKNTISVSLKREKIRGAMLSVCESTRKCITKKHIITVDTYLQELFGIKDCEIEKYIKDYSEIKKEMKEESLDLLRTEYDDDSINDDQRIYSFILNEFIKENASKDHKAFIIDLCDALYKKFEAKEILDIKKFLNDDSKYTPNDIIDLIPNKYSSLAAFFFVAKNPNNCDDFLNLLRIIAVDFITIRRACTLHGALNGARLINGEGTYKSNMVLWKYIETYTQLKLKDPLLPCFEISYIEDSDDKAKGLDLNCEKIITMDEVKECLQKNSNWLTDDIANSIILRFYKKKKDKEKYCKEIFNIPAHFSGNKSKDEWKLIQKKIKEIKPIIQIETEKLYTEIIKNFPKRYKENETFWKWIYNEQTKETS